MHETLPGQFVATTADPILVPGRVADVPAQSSAQNEDEHRRTGAGKDSVPEVPGNIGRSDGQPIPAPAIQQEAPRTGGRAASIEHLESYGI